MVETGSVSNAVYDCRVQEHCEERQLHHGEENGREDVLIVAGDVSDNLEVFRKTFELLTTAYEHVFFITGNHELWVRRQDREKYDSLGKLQELLRICDELGVKTKPTQLARTLFIVPIWSWYHSSWDREPDIPGAHPIEKVMLDFHACAWNSVPGLKSSGDDSLARYFDAMNDVAVYDAVLGDIKKARLEAEEGGQDESPTVISFSHFLPYQTLLPEKRWLFYPNLAKACGSALLLVV